jgi:LmbE family N-acetylglucosaminyl deacetylase
VHRAVLHGVQNLYPRVLVYSVAALVSTVPDHLWNQNEPAHLALDIRPWSAAKLAAMECHRSQHALFKRRRELQTVAEALRPVESVRRVWPFSPALAEGQPPDDPFAQLLRDAGAWTPDPPG